MNTIDIMLEERICCVCGNRKTGKNFNGKPLWYKYRNEKGIWDRKSYFCIKCYNIKRIYGHININEIENEIENKKKEYLKKKIEERKCCKCGEDKSNWSWYKYRNEKGIWDRKSYLCHTCGVYEDYNKNIKSIADWRTGQLSRYSSHGKGFIGVQIIAKTIGVEDCNIKTNNFCFYVDLSMHNKYGKSEVKTSTFHVRDNRWVFGGIKPENSDTIFLVCMDDNDPWNNVIRIYIIPSKYIDTNSIGISKDSFRSAWHDKYRVDEKPYDETYQNMDIKNCRVLRHDGR